MPFAEALQPILGMDAIWWSFPVGTVSSAILAYAYYRWGGWRKNKLMMAFASPGMSARPEPIAISADAGVGAAVTEEPAIPPAPSRAGADGIAELRREIEAMQRRHNFYEEASEN